MPPDGTVVVGVGVVVAVVAALFVSDDAPAAFGRTCGHGHDGPVQAHAAAGAVEGGVAVVEDAPVGGHEPVAPAVGGGGHGHDGPVEAHAAARAVEGGVAVVEDAPVGGHEPVAPGRRGWRPWPRWAG